MGATRESYATTATRLRRLQFFGNRSRVCVPRNNRTPGRAQYSPPADGGWLHHDLSRWRYVHLSVRNSPLRHWMPRFAQARGLCTFDKPAALAVADEGAKRNGTDESRRRRLWHGDDFIHPGAEGDFRGTCTGA